VNAETVSRFDGLTRIVHWSTAVAGAAVLATATVLYVPLFSAKVGRRATLMEIHVVAGLFLPVPLLFALAMGPTGARLRRDLAELWRWTAADRRWLRPKRRVMTEGKFNGGQKLVTALFAGLFLMQLLSGSVMFWHQPFSTSWRTGATFVHDWAYIALFVIVVGHITKALQEPVLMRAMTNGEVPREWARRERPTWDTQAEVVGGSGPGEAAGFERSTLMWVRIVGGSLLCLLGVIWILQGVDIVSGSGMSGHAIWAVFGAVLVVVGVMLLRAATSARRARS